MKLWQLGNTSVRSAMRIRDGLIAYSQSAIQGDIRSRAGDIRFRNLLGQCGIVALGEDQSNSVGRKWRAAMEKLGFLYPKIAKNSSFLQKDLGQQDTITPGGWNLIHAETVPAIQECFLRAMATPVETCENGKFFSPLCWTLTILLALEKRNLNAGVNFIEMALFVQTSTPDDNLENLISELLEFRKQREHAESKRSFDKKQYSEYAQKAGKVKGTFRDYADMNIRYLKATGMVHSYGKGISLIPEKHTLAVELTKHLFSAEEPLKRLQTLCRGASLPTDNASVARQVLNELLKQAKEYKISYSVDGKNLNNSAEINQIRYEIEELISGKREEEFARKQSEQWEEIAADMDSLASRKSKMLCNGVEISVEKAEAPAYLEWSLWRAFLAIDTLVNSSAQLRRFKIDQDFLPVSTAPGNGPDLIAEFQNFVVAIEVTLSENSRQEAMEGEPVRRHIADLLQKYWKPVYGLFIANNIDSNTAETFRIGVWYTSDDVRLDLQIVPLTLTQFSLFFKYIFSSGKANPQTLVDLLLKCSSFRRECAAPEWKRVIETTVENFTMNSPAQ